MIKSFFEEQRKYLNYFFDQLDLAKAEEILEKFAACQGSLVFTGVGKSGIIAQKLATTFISTGTKAFYMPPMNALHGDLGILNERDLFVVLSKSGETEEILKLLPYVRKKKAQIVSFISNPHSKLAKESDLWVCLPLLRELCPFDLAPTTSTTLQLIFGDVVAVAMMRKKNFSLDEYASNHPAGAIGKKITVQVNELMLKDDAIPVCKPQDRLIDVLCELSEKRCGCLLIVDEKKNLKGIFTDGDLRRAIQTRGGKALEDRLEELMTKAPLSITKEHLAIDAMKKMEANPARLITVLPVLDNMKVIGLIRMHDILQAGLK